MGYSSCAPKRFHAKVHNNTIFKTLALRDISIEVFFQPGMVVKGAKFHKYLFNVH